MSLEYLIKTNQIKLYQKLTRKRILQLIIIDGEIFHF